MIDCIAELNKRDIEYIHVGDHDVMIICPFHVDADPSLGIDIERKIFHCFGCDASGPFYKLIAELDGISANEAKQRFHEEDSVDITLSNLGKLFDDDDDEKPLRYYSKEAFHKTFPSVIGTPGEAYMTERRKIRPEMLLRFDVRWSRTGKYKNRVILPIYTLKGKLLSWTARTVLEGEKPKTRKARAARSTLYGAYELVCNQSAGYKIPTLFIVEGELDCMFAQQLNFCVVAAMGTSGLTNQQLAFVVRYAKRVVLSYDSDEAGQLATYGSSRREGDWDKLKRLLPVGVVKLPKGSDPNSLSIKVLQRLYNRCN